MRVIARREHYAAHLRPIAARVPGLDDVALVASYPDLVEARRTGSRRIVLAQHGAGQSYNSSHPHYPGGARNDSVSLFLVPERTFRGPLAAGLPFPTRVEIVGDPRLDELPARLPGRSPTIALAWHWDLHLVPETLSALSWYRPALGELARLWNVIGTGHPRRLDLAALYAGLGIPYVSFEEVCRQADVLAFDNTSAGFEFASTGRPVVVLDAPWYRREIEHGLRFWQAADIGVRIGRPEELAPALERALARLPEDERAREEALELVYPIRHGAAERAAAVILEAFG